MTNATETLTNGPAVEEQPEPVHPPTESQPEVVSHADSPDAPDSAADAGGGDDFATALENFTTESEEGAGEDNVIHGTVVKLTATHVVVDIGAKSEGMVPISEVQDHEGKPKFQPGDPIDVMREKGMNEEGYPNLSHQKAARLRAWDDIEKAFNDKKPIKGIVID